MMLKLHCTIKFHNKKMLSLNDFSQLDKGTAAPCVDDDRSTKKVRIREHPERLQSAEEDVGVTILGKNGEEASDMDLTESEDEGQSRGLYGRWKSNRVSFKDKLANAKLAKSKIVDFEIREEHVILASDGEYLTVAFSNKV